MDLIAAIEDHWAIIITFSGGVATIISMWYATRAKLTALDTSLNAHAKSTTDGFDRVCHRLDTINGRVREIEDEVGEVKLHCAAVHGAKFESHP